MRLPDFDPNVLPALREMHSLDPGVLELDELMLQGRLKDEGYLDYWPSLTLIGAALDSLAIERGTDLINRIHSYKAFHKGGNQGIPRSLLCARCTKRRDKNRERQRTVDHERYREILRNYREGSYAARRMKEEWGMLKKEVHSRDGYRCRMCNRKDRPLHVHHRTYQGYAEERLEDLITLCADCHSFFHSYSTVS